LEEYIPQLNLYYTVIGGKITEIESTPLYEYKYCQILNDSKEVRIILGRLQEVFGTSSRLAIMREQPPRASKYNKNNLSSERILRFLLYEN
jgi:hypothetical protein